MWQRPRKQKKTCGTQVCYLLVLQSCQIQPSVSPKLLSQFLPNLYILCLTYTLLYISNLKEIASGILRKIEGAMYYNIANFFHNLLSHLPDASSMLWIWKFFPTLYLLKVDCFKGFSNRSNVDKLVINSMSGRNYKNYKFSNNNYKLKNNLTWKQCFLILRTF